jgi:hypothetical protein
MQQMDENMSPSGTALDTGREQDCNAIREPKMAPHSQYSPPSTINTMHLSMRQKHLKQEQSPPKQATRKGISIRVDSKHKL